MKEYPSKLIEQAVNELSSLPGIGKKTALRFVLHLLKREPFEIERFGNTIIQMRNTIKYCTNCGNISDTTICEICNSHARDKKIICVVESIKDVMAIENTSQYNGLYHVLGGIISPIDGIGPKDLNIETLIERVKTNELTEVIIAIKPTMEGETTNFYIYKKLMDFSVKITQIARGVAIGDELEYTDEVTLGKSILNRVPYENTFAR
ncbi:MAG: recombination protein RecR [Bacteroidia bacterium]|nr:recombination protein RecR [Bacteroidia bacterium]